MKVVKVEAVVREMNFQKNEMIRYMKAWKVNEDIIDMAIDAFDTAIHGVEDHLEHYDLPNSSKGDSTNITN